MITINQESSDLVIAMVLGEFTLADFKELEEAADYALQSQNKASLLIDLSSHGESSGDRISFGRHEALGVQAALDWLRQRLPDEKLGSIGVSQGGASLLFAERQPELDALVLESVYPTITDAVQDRLVKRLGPAGAWAAPLLLLQVPLRLGVSVQDLRPVEAIRAGWAPDCVWTGPGAPAGNFALQREGAIPVLQESAVFGARLEKAGTLFDA